MTKIYSLSSSENLILRYVGVTERHLEDRLYDHIKQSFNKRNTRKARWVCSVIESEYKIIIESIEETDNWQERERWWIAELRASGVDLVDGTESGEDLPFFTEEVRQKMSAIQKNRFALPGAKAQHSTILRGIPKSLETRKRMSIAQKGRIITEQHRANIAYGLIWRRQERLQKGEA